MSQIRLVALDLDGTLRGPEHTVSAAMAGAPPDVAAAARYTTASNASDGVARALQHFVLGGPGQQRGGPPAGPPGR